MSKDFLQYVNGRLATYARAKSLYSERLAPDFTLFSFISPQETSLSRIIAWLLNPSGDHAQGEKFLDIFIKWLELTVKFSTSELAEAKVSVEIPTFYSNVPGFIDTYVKMDEFGLAIENKPYASDQPLQVERYLKDLGKRAPAGQCLLYLSGDGKPPSYESMSAELRTTEEQSGRFKLKSYEELVKWLERCAEINRAPSVQVVLEGFIRFIQKEFLRMADTDESRELAGTIIASREMLNSALAVVEAHYEVEQQLLEQFSETVEQAVRGRDGWSIARSNLNQHKHSGLIINFTPSAICGFGIQFDRSDYRYLFYGMQRLDGGYSDPILKKIVSSLLGEGKTTAWWPWWRAVGPNDHFFPMSTDADRQFWLGLQDGSVAQMVMNFASSMHERLQTEGALRLLEVSSRSRLPAPSSSNVGG